MFSGSRKTRGAKTKTQEILCAACKGTAQLAELSIDHVSTDFARLAAAFLLLNICIRPVLIENSQLTYMFVFVYYQV